MSTSEMQNSRPRAAESQPRSSNSMGKETCRPEKQLPFQYQLGIGPGDLKDISEAGSKTTWLTDPRAIYICTSILPAVACVLLFLFLLMVTLLMLYGAMRHWYLDSLLPNRFFALKPLRKDKLKVVYVAYPDSTALNNTGFFKWNSIRRCFRRHSVCQLHHKHRNHRKRSGEDNNDKLNTLRELRDMSQKTNNNSRNIVEGKTDFKQHKRPEPDLINPLLEVKNSEGDHKKIYQYFHQRGKRKTVSILAQDSLLAVVAQEEVDEPNILHLQQQKSGNNFTATENNRTATPKKKYVKKLRTKTGPAKKIRKDNTKKINKAKDNLKKVEIIKILDKIRTNNPETGVEHIKRKTNSPEDKQPKKIDDNKLRKNSKNADDKQRKKSKSDDDKQRKKSKSDDDKQRKKSKSDDDKQRKKSKIEDGKQRKNSKNTSNEKQRKNSKNVDDKQRKNSKKNEDKQRKNSKENDYKQRKNSKKNEDKQRKNSKEKDDKQRKNSKEKDDKQRKNSKDSDATKRKNSKNVDDKQRKNSKNDDGTHRKKSKKDAEKIPENIDTDKRKSIFRMP